MNIEEVLRSQAHLVSPAMLAMADTAGQPEPWVGARHLVAVNRVLMDMAFVPGMRVLINMPYQHGKSMLAAHYFPAWYLLHFPHKRIVLVAHNDDFAAKYGMKVRDILARWGGASGVVLREDTRAKGEWAIRGYEGGMKCSGPGGDIVGRPAELFVIDDLIRNAEEALSPVILERNWDFYKTVVFGRLRKESSLLMIGTRWTKDDLFGHVLRQAKETGERWEHFKFKAIAGEDDPLGRHPGEALWPEKVPLAHHEIARKLSPRWFSACWQQEPEDEEGAYFKPRGGVKGEPPWPRYVDMGDAWSVPGLRSSREVILKHAVTVVVCVDWAVSEKKGADFTAMGVFGILWDGRLLVLGMVNERLSLERCVPRLAEVCREWRPLFVCAESGGFQAAMLVECGRHAEIPAVRPVKPEGKSKLQRAYPAIVLGETGRILLPDDSTPSARGWLDGYMAQLAGFTGLGGSEKDDMVDVTAYAAQQASRIAPSRSAGSEGSGPALLTPGKEMFW